MAYAQKETWVEGGWRVIDGYGDYFIVATADMADHVVKMINNAYGYGKRDKAVEVRAVLGIK